MYYYTTYSPFQEPSQFYANQAYFSPLNDPLTGSFVNYGQSLVHSLPGYSPGGTSGSANPDADSINYINYTDSYLLPLAHQTFSTVTNTNNYGILSPNDILNVYDQNALIIDNTAPTANNLGVILDLVGFNNSQFM